MQIAYHLGAHCTDEGAVLRILLRNRAELAARGLAIPELDRYPALLRAAASAFAGHPVPEGTTETLLAALLPGDEAQDKTRMALSFEGFLAFPRDALSEDALYPAAGPRARGLAALFPGHQISFHLAIRNPATFVPALSERRRAKDQDPVPPGFDASRLRWSDLVTRLRAAVPDAALTVWCDEDTPLLWHSILRDIAGHPEELELAQALDLPSSLMQAVGVRRLAAWFRQRSPTTDAERRSGIAAQLSRFAQPEKMEVEVDFPGWPEDAVDTLSAAYDADCALIAGMDGVTLLRP